MFSRTRSGLTIDVLDETMLPMSYVVLQPSDVIAGVMTSSITVLPVISQYITDTYSTCTLDTRDDTAPSRETAMALHNPVSVSDGRLPQSADQVTWSIVKATPPHDDVIGHLPVTLNGESGSLDNNGVDEHVKCCDVTSGSGCASEEEQDGGRRRRQLYPLYCSVCRVRLNGGEQARQHFEGRTHARRVRLTSSASRLSDSAQHVSNSIHETGHPIA